MRRPGRGGRAGEGAGTELGDAGQVAPETLPPAGGDAPEDPRSYDEPQVRRTGSAPHPRPFPSAGSF